MLPDDLLSKFDKTLQAGRSDSRSRGLREAMQGCMEGHTTLDNIEGDGAVIIAFRL